MTSQHEKTAQHNQTAEPKDQNNGRPESKVAVLASTQTQADVLDHLKQLREKIAKEVREFDQKDIPENLQTEIPKIAVLVQRIERLVLDKNHSKNLAGLNSLICSLEVALSSLFQKKLSKEFTRQIRLDVEKEVIRHEHLPIIGLLANQFFYIWHSKSVRLSVIYGLSWSFIIMFGGLFSLALIQYAAYNSNEESRTIQSLTDKKSKRIENLNAQIERLQTQLFKEASSEPTGGDKELSEQSRIQKLASITDLRNKVKNTQAEIYRLESRQESSQLRHGSGLKVFLSSIDIGFAKTLSQILWVAAAGTLGSIISILIRVIGKSYDQEAYCDRLTPIFIGFFKPVIGASFGVLFLAFINSGVISTPLIPVPNKVSEVDATLKTTDSAETKAAFFLFSVAFVVGFSERLAKDTITKLEGGNDDGKEDKQQSQTRVVVIRMSKPVNRSDRNRQNTQPLQPPVSMSDDESL